MRPLPPPLNSEGGWLPPSPYLIPPIFLPNCIRPPSVSTNPMLLTKPLLHLQPRWTHRPRKRKATAIGRHRTTHTSLRMTSLHCHCRSRFGTGLHYAKTGAAPPHKQHPPPQLPSQLNFSRVVMMLRLMRSNCRSKQMLHLPGGQPRVRKMSTRIRSSRSSSRSSSSSRSIRKIGNNRIIVMSSMSSISIIIS